jgi:hypothetical protein
MVVVIRPPPARLGEKSCRAGFRPSQDSRSFILSNHPPAGPYGCLEAAPHRLSAGDRQRLRDPSPPGPGKTGRCLPSSVGFDRNPIRLSSQSTARRSTSTSSWCGPKRSAPGQPRRFCLDPMATTARSLARPARLRMALRPSATHAIVTRDSSGVSQIEAEPSLNEIRAKVDAIELVDGCLFQCGGQRFRFRP